MVADAAAALLGAQAGIKNDSAAIASAERTVRGASGRIIRQLFEGVGNIIRRGAGAHKGGGRSMRIARWPA
jgi:hypothetical protein